MKKSIFFLVALFMSVVVSAQSYKLSKQQHEDLKKAAINKVERFQENCRLVAGDAPYNEKTCSGGIIDITMQDFLKDAKIEITALNSNSKSRKLVKRYLLNLALLRKNRYKDINISWWDCAMVENFVKDLNKSKQTGEEWYVGEVTLYQRFNGVTKEGRVVNDVVRRTTKVYANKKEIYSARGASTTYWDVKLGDIQAESIE